MSDYTANAPTKQCVPVSLWLWYEGTDALREGEALCFNISYGTATDKDGRRGNHVTRPGAANAGDFAGVAARDYMASPTGRFIEVYGPGSRGVSIALGTNATLNTGLLTFQVGGGDGAGRWVTGKYRGIGAAIPRQTVSGAVVTDGMDGSWSLATDGVTLTVADTSTLAPGGIVVLLGGKNEGSGKAIVPGKHVIAAITDANTLVLSQSAVGATPTGALTCTGYAYLGNPKCQADLVATGNPVGGAEFVAAAAANGGAVTTMAGGVTYFIGDPAITGDATATLAQATHVGAQKAFFLLPTMSTKDFIVALATAGLQLDGSTALAKVAAIDAAGDGAYLEFNGAKWRAISLIGGASASAS